MPFEFLAIHRLSLILQKYNIKMDASASKLYLPEKMALHQKNFVLLQKRKQ
jgi:hypothetical protein